MPQSSPKTTAEEAAKFNADTWFGEDTDDWACAVEVFLEGWNEALKAALDMIDAYQKDGPENNSFGELGAAIVSRKIKEDVESLKRVEK